ncbi:hypothetical protein ANN_01505 [Periplaneta americana]|uniref:Uncharacterized protein n=1 Tax=Periplaneta americana TaxID=6978 RepID=A0ABQ8TUU3_PERAM|nr:hypothetical protein ANN_01505 [Periplaneta americana]
MAGLCEDGNEPPGSLKPSNEEKRIKAFETCRWRRMELVKWTDRIRNEAVWDRVGEERIILKLIRKRKRNWLGLWLRRNCLLKDALRGLNRLRCATEFDPVSRRGLRRNRGSLVLYEEFTTRVDQVHLE